MQKRPAATVDTWGFREGFEQQSRHGLVGSPEPSRGRDKPSGVMVGHWPDCLQGSPLGKRNPLHLILDLSVLTICPSTWPKGTFSVDSGPPAGPLLQKEIFLYASPFRGFSVFSPVSRYLVKSLRTLSSIFTYTPSLLLAPILPIYH